MKTRPINESDLIDDRHPVEYIEPLEQSVASKQSEIIMAIIHWMLKQDTTPKEEIPLHIAARVMVLSVALNIDSTSYACIGRATGLTREAIRLMARELEDDFGLRSSNARSDDARRAAKRARWRNAKQGA